MAQWYFLIRSQITVNALIMCFPTENPKILWVTHRTAQWIVENTGQNPLLCQQRTLGDVSSGAERKWWGTYPTISFSDSHVFCLRRGGRLNWRRDLSYVPPRYRRTWFAVAEGGGRGWVTVVGSDLFGVLFLRGRGNTLEDVAFDFTRKYVRIAPSYETSTECSWGRVRKAIIRSHWNESQIKFCRVTVDRDTRSLLVTV